MHVRVYIVYVHMYTHKHTDIYLHIHTYMFLSNAEVMPQYYAQESQTNKIPSTRYEKSTFEWLARVVQVTPPKM